MELGFLEGRKFQSDLEQLVSTLPHSEAVHISALDFSAGILFYAGVRDREPVYPGSMYKLDVAVATVNEVAKGNLRLEQMVTVAEHNVVDEEGEAVPDGRPPLKAGAEVPVYYLLELMLTASRNTPANVLIDLVTREKINALLHEYGWQGSEVTRKFLKRPLEDEKYREAPPTMQTVRHFTEMLYLIQTDQLPFSGMLLPLLSRQLDHSKLKKGFPPEARFSHKTGWFNKDPRLNMCGDCGILEWGYFRFVISCIVRLSEPEGSELLQEIGRRLAHFIISS